MAEHDIEWRRERRVTFQAPLLVRRADSGDNQKFDEETVESVSLDGIFFHTNTSYSKDDILVVNITVPENRRTRDFPFTRLAGHVRVIRADELSADEQTKTSKKYGVAAFFESDFTKLTSVPGPA